MTRRSAIAALIACALLGTPLTAPRPLGAWAASPPSSLAATAAWAGGGAFYELRAAPTTTARVVGHVVTGASLRILSGVGGTAVGGDAWWYRIRLGRATGYLSSTAVQTVAATPDTWVALATSDGDPSIGAVTARRAPTAAAPMAARYPLGAHLTVLGRQGGTMVEAGDAIWYRIAQGALPPVYVYSAYLKFARWGAVAPPAPLLTAPAAVALDLRTGRVLVWRNGAQRRRPASTVKIMTALVALRHLSPAARLVVPHGLRAVTTDVDGSSMGLAPGENLSLHDLLYGLLLPSGNDAAYTIAQGVAGSQGRFVALMNAEAARLGLRDTHYTNATGLDERGEYTSADDLARLARDALLHAPLVATIVRTPVYRIGPAATHPAFTLHSLNALLGHYPGADGVKTGTTPEAGQNLVAAATRLHHTVIAVVLGASDRYADATALLDEAFATL